MLRHVGKISTSLGTVIPRCRTNVPKRSCVEACILDWSGTVSDKYVIAPAIAFQQVFSDYGIEVSMEEARVPMGLRKDLHIKKMLLGNNRISEMWNAKYGYTPTLHDVGKLFEDFVPIQLHALHEHATLLPDVNQTIQYLRVGMGIKVGSTTGFTREMVEVLETAANKQGAYFDTTVAGDEVSNGARPAPHMVYKNMDNLGIDSPVGVVKVDDTVGGIGEGLSAGCWTVGVSRFSNYMDIDSLEHERELTHIELDDRNQKTRVILAEAGAHYVIDTVNELPRVINDINNKLKNGVVPSLDEETVILDDNLSMPLL